jgi:hypothetical protein
VEREEEEVLLMILEGSGESIPETLFLSLSLFCSVVFNNNNETHSLAIFIFIFGYIFKSILERERECVRRVILYEHIGRAFKMQAGTQIKSINFSFLLGRSGLSSWTGSGLFLSFFLFPHTPFLLYF